MRAFLLVIDGLGCGAMPDAARYGDEGSNTLANTAEAVDGLALPHLAGLGLGHILPIRGVPAVARPTGLYGRMAERSAGKDTTTGHWELAGLPVEQPFPVYPRGFPREVIEPFEEAVGRKVLGNVPASGTVILDELGARHLATGRPIVYTSADSVFQVAAHEAVVPVEQLYEWCRIARAQLAGAHAVCRVIARPFEGEPGEFRRTPRRRDFSLAPHGETLLDRVLAAGMSVRGVGKIDDIFAGRGLTDCVHTRDNEDGVERILERLRTPFDGLLFANLVDTDMRWGHRNDAEGYARSLEGFDRRLPELLTAAAGDLVLITGDHGVDPTTASTDHSREYVPIVIRHPAGLAGPVGTRETFADVAATLAAWLGLAPIGPGRSMLDR